MKPFIITIDTEGDNLWALKSNDKVNTKNTLFLSRFQDLCEKYGFKPTWLTNYEMINDDKYVEFIKGVVERNSGELGMHLHAWNNPPLYKLSQESSGKPFLIEYSKDIMEEKVASITETIINRSGIRPVSHRAGRWAINDTYYQILASYGYKVDCSITPHVNWNSSLGQTKDARGCNYSHFPEYPYFVEGVLEVPMTIRKTHALIKPHDNSLKSVLKTIYYSCVGQTIWMRPTTNNLHTMLWLVSHCKINSDYLMFMLHSSELMPGGNPTFNTLEKVDQLYKDLDVLFKAVAKDYYGCTLKEFADRIIGSNNSL